MAMKDVILLIDKEIARLQQVRKLLGSLNKLLAFYPEGRRLIRESRSGKRSHITPKGRERLRRSTRRRWREMKKAGLNPVHLGKVNRSVKRDVNKEKAS